MDFGQANKTLLENVCLELFFRRGYIIVHDKVARRMPPKQLIGDGGAGTRVVFAIPD